MNLVQPRPGEGWDRLLMTPKYNGGDIIPEELRAGMDAALDQVQAVGLVVENTPSVIYTLQPVFHEDGTQETIVHWASDGRTPLKTSLDVLDALVMSEPNKRFLAFVRRPALVRLLASRGWWLQSHEDSPFMALLVVCQESASSRAS